MAWDMALCIISGEVSDHFTPALALLETQEWIAFKQ